jgi:hypothetical protein
LKHRTTHDGIIQALSFARAAASKTTRSFGPLSPWYAIENIALHFLLSPSVRRNNLYIGYSSSLLYNLSQNLGLNRIVS